MFVDRILELNEIFRRNREKAQALSNPVVKARIAAVAAEEEAEEKIILARTAKVKQLLEFGYNRSEIAERLNMNPYTVDFVISRIREEDKQMDPMFAGWKRKSGGYVSYASGLPTRR